MGLIPQHWLLPHYAAGGYLPESDPRLRPAPGVPATVRPGQSNQPPGGWATPTPGAVAPPAPHQFRQGDPNYYIPGGHGAGAIGTPPAGFGGAPAGQQFGLGGSGAQGMFGMGSNYNFNPGQYAPMMGSSAGALGGLFGTLRNQINGGGPNLADAELQKATQQNIANAYAMAQANPNDPGAMRNIANQVGQLNQQAAQDAAINRMQQQFAAQGQLGQLGLGAFGTSGRLMTDADQLALQQSQGNQALNSNIIGGALNGAGATLSQIPGMLSGMFKSSTPGTPGVGDSTGGDLNNPATPISGGDGQPGANPGGTAGGGSLPRAPTPLPEGGDSMYRQPGAFAHGGLISSTFPHLMRHYDDGGMVAPNANPADFTDYSKMGTDVRMADPMPLQLQPPMRGGGPATSSSGSNTGQLVASGLSAIPILGGIAAATYPIVRAQDQKMQQAYAADAARREAAGETPSPSPWGDVGKFFNNLFHGHAQGGLISMLGGGHVPGRAKMAGDHAQNDTVPAMLSPGEVVLPRSVTEDDEAPEKARAFVQAIRKKHRKAA